MVVMIVMIVMMMVMMMDVVVMIVVNVFDMLENCVRVMMVFYVIRYMNDNMFMMWSINYTKRSACYEHNQRYQLYMWKKKWKETRKKHVRTNKINLDENRREN